MSNNFATLHTDKRMTPKKKLSTSSYLDTDPPKRPKTKSPRIEATKVPSIQLDKCSELIKLSPRPNSARDDTEGISPKPRLPTTPHTTDSLHINPFGPPRPLRPPRKRNRISVKQNLSTHGLLLKIATNLFSAMGLEEETQTNIIHQIKKSVSVKKIKRTLLCPQPIFEKLETINNDIDDFKNRQILHKSAVLIQSRFRGYLTRKKFLEDKQSYNPSKITAFHEICEKEKNFVMSLATLISQYIVPLRMTQDKHLKKMYTQLSPVFSEIEAILEVHQALLKIIYEIPRNSWPCLEGLGNVFTSIAPHWKIYGKYVHNFKQAMDLIENSVTNEHFRDFLDSKLKRINMNLQTFLSLPITHIAGYSEILRKILDSTSQDQLVERNSLEQAIIITEETSNFIENTLNRAENLSRIKRIRKTFNDSKMTTELFGKLLDNNYTYILDSVVEFSMPPKKKRSSGVLYLFEALCFLCTCKSKEISVKYVYNLNNTTITAHDSDPNAFSLLIIDEERPSYDNIIGGSHYVFYVDSSEKRDNWVKNVQNMITHNQRNRTFGIPLSALVERDKPEDGIPVVIKDLVTFLRETGMDTQGLFRIPGTNTLIKKAKTSYNQSHVTGKYPNLKEIEGFSANDAAGLLKMYFHDLPEPLIPHQLYSEFLGAQEHFKQHNNLILFLQDTKLLVQKMPTANRIVLIYLCQFMSIVASHEETKMTPANLATCFGPNILRPLQQTIDSTLALPVSNKCVEYMIQHCDILFGGDVGKARAISQ